MKSFGFFAILVVTFSPTLVASQFTEDDARQFIDGLVSIILILEYSYLLIILVLMTLIYLSCLTYLPVLLILVVLLILII
jgi:hypothetical protein